MTRSVGDFSKLSPTNVHCTVRCKFRTVRCTLRSVWDEIVKLKKILNIKNGWSWHWTLQARVICKYVIHWDTPPTGNNKVNELILNCQVIAYYTNFVFIIISSVRYAYKFYGTQIYIISSVGYRKQLYGTQIVFISDGQIWKCTVQ